MRFVDSFANELFQAILQNGTCAKFEKIRQNMAMKK